LLLQIYFWQDAPFGHITDDRQTDTTLKHKTTIRMVG